MNLAFAGTISRLTPAGVPSYDPSRWFADTKDDDAAYILENLPVRTTGESVTTRRIAMFKASPYMPIAECRHMAERIVADCQKMWLYRQAQTKVDTSTWPQD